MKLDKAKFRKWLRAKPTREVVGRHRDSLCCPIALFYSQASGCEIAILQDFGCNVIDRGYSKRRMPSWAEAFVSAVDEREDTEITASIALEILEMQ